jgi:hypothetical protein
MSTLRRMRRLPLLALVAALAACGGSSHSSAPPTTTARPAPGPGDVLYQGTSWSVVLDGTKASVQHLVGGRWRTDRSHNVRISILGPHGKAPRRPQVAAELVGDAPLVESALWVDGRELFEKGGGLNPKRGTIYGAPDAALAPGTHVAVAYARTAQHGAAVAWTFRT